MTPPGMPCNVPGFSSLVLTRPMWDPRELGETNKRQPTKSRIQEIEGLIVLNSSRRSSLGQLAGQG